MTNVQAINGLSFGEGERKTSSGPGFLSYAAGIGAGAAVGGYVKKREINPKEVLTADKFELATTEGLTAEQTKAKEAIDGIKAKGVDAEVAEKIKTIIPDDAKADVSVEEYLKKQAHGITDAAKLEEKITTAKGETEGLTKAVADAEVAVKSAADDTAKAAKQAELTTAEGKLAAHTERIATLEADSALVKGATEGKITRDAIKGRFAEEINATRKTTVTEALETLKGKLPKKFSGKAAAVGAAIGLAVIWLGSKIFGSKD